ncbi:MAG TPA: hypothetical protein VHI72_06970 [Hyphomicrobiaceae bacterium]|jgi:hypothetical protein|nr:hypothetical protein [Hyphomicrobiaceae bacterium]
MRSLVVLSVFGFGLATVAVAEPDTDCGRAYKGMLTTIERKKPTLSAEAQVALQRTALRIYDACLTGHLDRPGQLFDKLDRTRY